MQKIRKILKAISEKTVLPTNQPINQPTNQLLPKTLILYDLVDPGPKMLKIKDNDLFRNLKITSLNNQRQQYLEALEYIKKRKTFILEKIY